MRLSLFAFLFLGSGELLSSVFGQTAPPGITSNGNPSNPPVSPSTGPYTENVVIPASVLACTDPDLVPDSATNTWSYTQIATAFYRYSVAPWNFPSASNPQAHISDCIAALTIVSGECQPNPNPSLGCLTSTGPSGVFQTDFIRTIPGYSSTTSYMNLCTTAFGSGYMIAPFPASSTQSCTISIGTGQVASIYTCMNAPSTVNAYGASCQDPASVSGTVYTNFIGPFCHKAYAQRYSPCTNTGPDCCANWNGGGNSGQPAFPNYYYGTAATVGSSIISNACTTAAAAATSSPGQATTAKATSSIPSTSTPIHTTPLPSTSQPTTQTKAPTNTVTTPTQSPSNIPSSSSPGPSTQTASPNPTSNSPTTKQTPNSSPSLFPSFVAIMLTLCCSIISGIVISSTTQ